MGEDRISGTEMIGRVWTPAHREAVAVEIDRILAHPAFKGSNRCVTLLKYLVDHALTGDEIGTKERTLGIEVFGREATYDTNSDPIVRRTANEIRKRLAQYYLEADEDRPVRIHLQRGSYLLEFEFAADDGVATSVPAYKPEALPASPDVFPVSAAVEIPVATSAISQRQPKSGPAKWQITLLVSAAALVPLSAFLLVHFRTRSSPQYNLWKPMLQSGSQITVCLSDLTSNPNGPQGNADSASPGGGLPRSSNNFDISRFSSDTPFLDANVAQAISARLAEYKIQTRLHPCSALQLRDFGLRSTVLIGGTNNPWALILLSKLSDSRYSIRVDPVSHDRWIQDAQKPSDRKWDVDGNLHDNDVSVDYGIITRFFSKQTGQWMLVLSGLEAHGTEAAGELVADPAFAKLLSPKVGATGNVQIVFKTSVIRGTTGPIEVLAIHTW